MKYKEKALWLW